MDEVVTTNAVCSSCHIVVKPSDYFCSNCGKNLHPVPLGVTLLDQIKLYLGSVFLAPMGIIWGMRYLREKEEKSKIVGVIAMLLSVVTLIVAIQYTVNFANTINSQVDKQLQGIEEF